MGSHLCISAFVSHIGSPFMWVKICLFFPLPAVVCSINITLVEIDEYTRNYLVLNLFFRFLFLFFFFFRQLFFVNQFRSPQALSIQVFLNFWNTRLNPAIAIHKDAGAYKSLWCLLSLSDKMEVTQYFPSFSKQGIRHSEVAAVPSAPIWLK